MLFSLVLQDSKQFETKQQAIERSDVMLVNIAVSSLFLLPWERDMGVGEEGGGEGGREGRKEGGREPKSCPLN